jgi:glucose dehydrogenase
VPMFAVISHRAVFSATTLGLVTAVGLVISVAAPRGVSHSESVANPSTRFSDLSQLTAATVPRLAAAWTFHTGDYPGGQPHAVGSVPGFQTRPVLAGDLLVVTTTTSRVIAIDAETGTERWRFDPFSARRRTCEQPHRGVAVWEAHDATGTIVRTVLSGTCDGRLIALDASTGRLHTEFADGGVLDLRPGADAHADEMYALTSPPAIYKDLVIVGSAVPEETSQGPSGDVRAFDVRTGHEVWRFHTVPRPGEFGHDTWPIGAWKRRTGVNVWSTMSVDEARGLVFLPVGSASYDFFGGDRRGNTLYANSIVALDAATGRRRWHFQLVHHDLWDYDPPAQPILADIRRDGRIIPAVVQLTKMGLVFVFDRVTGQPLFGIEERRVPASDIHGEFTSPTQPFPLKPKPLSRITAIAHADLTTVTEASHRACETIFRTVRSGGIFTPPGRDLTVWYPGTLGGATWSGGAFDPSNGYLFVNTNDIGALGRMAQQPPGASPPYRRESQWGAYARFWDDAHLPCQQPPWGQLHAVNLATGDIVWQLPLGDPPQLAGTGVRATGTPNLGGAIATAGGLVFIAATNDRQLRAFESRSGQLLWHAELPASGHATPTTYRGPHSGRQFVVVAAGGGGRFSSAVSDAIVAFALPTSRATNGTSAKNTNNTTTR